MTRLLGKVAVGAAGAVLLTGCGGNSSSTPDATGSTAGSTSTQASDPTSPSSPSSTSTSVAPATGRKLDVEGFSVRTPKGFDRELGVLARNKVIVNSKTSDQIAAVYITSIGPVPLSEAVRLARRNSLGGDKLARLPDVEVAGQTFYRLAGKPGTGRYVEEYGAIVDGSLCALTFTLRTEPAARKQIVASVLASFTLN